MLPACVLLTTVLAATAPSLTSAHARFFPGSYFDTVARYPLQARALTVGPGPTELVRRWSEDELDDSERVSALLGASAYHDPDLLPMYRAALGLPSQRVRRAAAWGYRDLIGDRLPDVRAEIDDRSAALLAREIAAVEETLRSQPLPAMWLQALLVPEGASVPGYSGIVLNRSRGDALRSIDEVVGPHDLTLLVAAYEASDATETRIAIVRLVEGLALERFIEEPASQGVGWGPKIYERAFEAFEVWIDRWTAAGCAIDAGDVLMAQFERLGLPPVDPFGGAACGAWQQVLLRGLEAWWGTAAGELYRCGGPPAKVPVLRVDAAGSRAARENVLRFYRLRPTARSSRSGD